MSLNVKLAEAIAPDGGRLTLYEHGGDFCIRLNGLPLMHSAAVSSELLLGEVAVEALRASTAPCILIGGLGLGFTLKSVLQKVEHGATVSVAELVPEVVLWNQQFLSHLNGALLDDPRVDLIVADVWDVITHAGEACYDAVLMDVDNGPKAMVQEHNSRLYSRSGLERIAAALKPGGRAVFWSAGPAPQFSARLVAAGLRVKAIPARFCPTARYCAGTLYVADKPGSVGQPPRPSAKRSGACGVGRANLGRR